MTLLVLYLKSIKIRNAEGIIFNKKIDQYFPSLILDEKLIPITKQYKIDVSLKETDQVISFDFTNELTKKKVEKKHIYYNRASKKFMSNYSIGTDKEIFVKDKNLKTLTVKTGAYIIRENFMTPYGYRVVLEAGVKFVALIYPY